MEHQNIIESLEYLEDILDESSPVPFTTKVMVDKKRLCDVIVDIRLKLPNSIKQAEWVVQERNKILNDAKKEAQNILRESEQYANRLVNDNEIIKKANVQAKKVVDTAKSASREIKLGAYEYADNILYNVERSLRDAVDVFHQQCMEIEDTYTGALQVVENNRKELRGVTTQNSVDSEETE
ncbi:MAG: hypothetical protein A2Y24_04290 [Clostridiales bacterium GWE2_32_10]|nr:MAG: hypothetical protein A2Y24_04290 [Clostridiales bacterium GWE2_32_10]HBY20877.1 ATPase [Clostridiales bacterium]